MPTHICGNIDRVFFVRWLQPAQHAPHEVLQELKAAFERRGEKLIYIAIVPEECTTPDERTRQAMATMIPMSLEYADMVIIVIEGNGFATAMKRTALSAMLLLDRSREKGKLVAHRTCEQGLRAAATQLSIHLNVASILKEAALRGYTTSDTANAKVSA